MSHFCLFSTCLYRQYSSLLRIFSVSVCLTFLALSYLSLAYFTLSHRSALPVCLSPACPFFHFLSVFLSHSSSRSVSLIGQLTFCLPVCVSPVCLSVILLLSILCLGVLSQPITDSDRLFSLAISRIQHLHLLAQRLLSDFVSERKTQITHTSNTHNKQTCYRSRRVSLRSPCVEISVCISV